jgi:hypothetical protein
MLVDKSDNYESKIKSKVMSIVANHIQEVIAVCREFGVFARFAPLPWLRSRGAIASGAVARVDFPLEREDERPISQGSPPSWTVCREWMEAELLMLPARAWIAVLCLLHISSLHSLKSSSKPR